VLLYDFCVRDVDSDGDSSAECTAEASRESDEPIPNTHNERLDVAAVAAAGGRVAAPARSKQEFKDIRSGT
jgi:hypothetical protein